MKPTNIESAKQQLQSIVASFERPARGKLALLLPLREEILELDKRGAVSADIAAILAQCQITVSKDTVARFLRTEKQKDRKPRTRQPIGYITKPTADKSTSNQ